MVSPPANEVAARKRPSPVGRVTRTSSRRPGSANTPRRYPPVHAIPRVTTEPVELGGYEIPAGADVLWSVWSIHRDLRFYDAPETFGPDRCAETTPREKGYAFVPFGAGPRICIGRHFVRLELKAVLATVGRRYRFDADGSLDFAPQMTTQPADPVRVRLRES